MLGYRGSSWMPLTEIIGIESFLPDDFANTTTIYIFAAK